MTWYSQWMSEPSYNTFGHRCSDVDSKVCKGWAGWQSTSRDGLGRFEPYSKQKRQQKKNYQ